MTEPLKDEPQKSAAGRMGIAALILAVSMVLSRVLGFMREAIIAHLHGASAATDAYYAAFTVPDLMNYFLAGGTLSITFIPLFSAHMSKDDEAGGWRLFSTVATTMGSVLLVFTVLLTIFTPFLVPYLFPGFSGNAEQLELTIRMTRIVLPAQLAFYLGGLIQATLFVRETFWPAAISPLIYNLGIILGGVCLAPWFGIEGFAVGVLVGAVLGPLGVPLWAARKQIKFRPRFAPTDPAFLKFVWVTVPLMLGVSLVTVDEWLLRYFGSMHAEGAISWLNNSRKLMMFGFAVIGQAAGQAALPYLTRLYHEGKIDEMGEMLAESLRRVAFLSVVASVGLITLAQPIVFVVFRRGAYSTNDAQMTAELLTVFAVGLTAWAVQTMAVRGFYAQEDTWTPMILGSVVTVASLPLYWFLNQSFGLLGLAAATSIGMSVNAIATLVVFRIQGGGLPVLPVVLGSLRGLAFAVACGLPAHAVVYNLREWAKVGFTEQLVTLSAGAGAFGFVALLLILAFRPQELEVVVGKIMRKLKR